MATSITLARPYAKAVFLMAKFSGLYSQWSEILCFLSTVVNNSRVQSFINNRTIAPTQKIAFFEDIGEGILQQRAKNLLKVLAVNGRLGIIPEVSTIFEELRSKEESKIKLEITTAYKIDKVQLDKLQNALSKHFAMSVFISCKIDENLVGGIIMQFGDRVIDASVKGRLLALYNNLKQ